jgi:hypothetical protein
MNDNWRTYQRQLAALLGNMPLIVPLERAVAPFGKPVRRLAPLPIAHCEQPVARLHLPGIDRDRS